MAKSLVGALALSLLPSALAFQNTSPFFFFSTADLTLNENNVEVIPSEYVAEYVKATLEGCPSRTYFVVRQDGVSSVDFLDRLSAPRLATYMTGEQAQIKTTISASEVIGKVDTHALSEYLQTACGADASHIHIENSVGAPTAGPLPVDAPPRVIEVTLPAPSASNRAAALAANDLLLEDIVTEFAPSTDYTVIYTTTPRTEEEHAYEMEDAFDGGVRMELKRDTAFVRRDKAKEGGLFERYQYFSPGLFMAFTAMIPLVLILAVGLNAIANLEVSYFAFSKEMGPTAQKKQ